MAEAFGDPRLKHIGEKARYRDSDTIPKPSREIVGLVPEFQKISGARRIAPHLTREGNHSRSFQVTIEAIERLFKEQQTMQ